jgi:5-methylcytosine-specific restriction protein A
MQRVPYAKSPFAAVARKASTRMYDRTRRNPAARAFYQSRDWRDKLQPMKLHQSPLCEPCYREGKIVQAVIVHHKVPISVDMSLARDLDNLESSCRACHNRVHHGSE